MAVLVRRTGTGVALAIVVVSLVAAAATPLRAEITEDDYRALNAALVEHYVVPRYRELEAASAELVDVSTRFCDRPLPRNLAALEAAFNRTMDAWMAVEHLRFGPVEREMRPFRIYFWPDTRDSVGRQVEEALSGDDPVTIDAETIADASVALQGLPALEYLLFTPESRSMLLGGGALTARHCALMTAITSNIAAISSGILKEWTEGADAYAATVSNAGAGADAGAYATARDASLEFFQSFHDGLDLIADAKLNPVLGKSADKSRPTLAESWRSGRSLTNIVENLAALERLYLGEGGEGFSRLAIESGSDPELDPLMRRAFEITLQTARDIDGPLSDAVADARRSDVERLLTQVRALKQIVRTRLADATGLRVGFNASDGD
jgi:predicted lipoprotein